MFEKLQTEIQRIGTPKFHLFDLSSVGESSNGLSYVSFPPSYQRFLEQFGGAKLYRQGSVYLVQVFPAPILTETEKYGVLYQFGRTDRSLAYFRRAELKPHAEAPTYDWSKFGGLRRTGNSFEEWIGKRCKVARKQYSKKEWQSILKGPVPFSPEELAIIEARKEFTWRVVGSADNGDMRFEVHNGSGIRLAYITIGIRAKDQKFSSRVWLPTWDIAPGQTGYIEQDCYKDRFSADKIEAVVLPDPCPEDRDRYWEFKTIE